MIEASEGFPPFNLSKLLKTVFEPQAGESIALLIDLDNPDEVIDFAFSADPAYEAQTKAVEVFYRGLHDSAMSELGLTGGELFAYQITGGSNLDLPDAAIQSTGRRVSLESDVYNSYDIILCISSYSATAPLTASAKRHGFRGATLHGINDIILRTGLAVDYSFVSREAEKIREGLTKADAIEIDFCYENTRASLRLELGQQEAQKSHGLCRGKTPDVANLPAGEVYFVPKSAHGKFPLTFEDSSIGLMEVLDGKIVGGSLLKGEAETLQQAMLKFSTDPASAVIGELGFGTQKLPASGRDIQDEKILGSVHVATGRSDHLGGDVTPDKFHEKSNATHDDILFSSTKTPEIDVPQVRMQKNGESVVLIEHYRPSKFIENLLRDPR